MYRDVIFGYVIFVPVFNLFKTSRIHFSEAVKSEVCLLENPQTRPLPLSLVTATGILHSFNQYVINVLKQTTFKQCETVLILVSARQPMSSSDRWCYETG